MFLGEGGLADCFDRRLADEEHCASLDDHVPVATLADDPLQYGLVRNVSGSFAAHPMASCSCVRVRDEVAAPRGATDHPAPRDGYASPTVPFPSALARANPASPSLRLRDHRIPVAIAARAN